MGLHIEISTPLSHDEWTAIAAVAAIMLGETGATVEPAPALAAAGIGVDADRPVVAAAPIIPPPPPASEALMANEAARVAPVVPPPPPPPSAPAGVDVDNTGLPWDLRIHAATKAKNKDGSWRNKRGAETALIEQVTAELRSVMAAPVPPAGAVEAAPVHTDPAAAFGAGTPPPAPIVADPVPVETAEAAGVHPEFARIMRDVVAKQTAKTLTTAQTTAICVAIGITSVRDLQNRPDLIPAFEAMLPK